MQLPRLDLIKFIIADRKILIKFMERKRTSQNSAIATKIFFLSFYFTFLLHTIITFLHRLIQCHPSHRKCYLDILLFFFGWFFPQQRVFLSFWSTFFYQHARHVEQILKIIKVKKPEEHSGKVCKSLVKKWIQYDFLNASILDSKTGRITSP